MNTKWRNEPLFDSAGAVVVDDHAADGADPWHRWLANETTGSYATEEEAKADFIAHINDDHWDVAHEVRGEVIQPKIGVEKSAVSADYILFPKENIIAQGWTIGPICVEVKRSGVKLGHVFSQAQDYLRCLFTVPGGLECAPVGMKFMPMFCVIFPLDLVGGAFQSAMSHSRVGHSHVGIDGRLRLYLNGAQAYSQTGGVFLRAALKSGNKFGSRS